MSLKLPDDKSVVLESSLIVRHGELELVRVLGTISYSQLVSDPPHVYIVLREAGNSCVELSVDNLSKLAFLGDLVNQVFWLRIRICCFQRTGSDHASGNIVDILEVEQARVRGEPWSSSV